MPWAVNRMWKDMGYESPSASHLNGLWQRGFLRRRFLQVVGPHPVIMKGRYAGFEKKQWFNARVIERRTFEIFYGYNPRCCHKGTYDKPGHSYGRTWGHTFYEAVHNRAVV